MQDAPYKIYNASAGSGKTYTLAKEYLKIILSSDFNRNYRSILAITFTNKAVDEMKQRILGSLFTFGETSANMDVPPMLLDISQELGVDVATLSKRSKQVLKEILHNYAFFDVSTVDKFTHRLIRTFAKDLKLPQNFDVVMDTNLLLDEAIARLINRAGSNAQLTKVLIDFALEKIDDDKSWDITFDLQKIGKLIFNENHAEHLNKLETKGIDDFLALKKDLIRQISVLQQKIIEQAKDILAIIQDNGLEFNNFKSSYFPKFMVKIASGDLNIDFAAGWKQKFDTDPLYAKSCPQDIKSILDGLHPRFIDLFNEIKDNHLTLSLFKNVYGNIVPLTVINAIQQEIKNLELEQDLLPISSFNSIISKEIKGQPAPFIYERIGEKYRHYFVDEFQDTSQMQWNNLIPLIGNALESQDEMGKIGSLLLVGDAKQAIYRWRGGKAEQFLNLIDLKENPFVFPAATANLPANYRSHEEVIKFNNDFFTVTSPFLESELYNRLFTDGNKQQYNHKKGGLVQLSFIDKEEEDEAYCNRVVNILEQVLQKNHPLKDICILTRKKKHGVLLADFLMQRKIPIISSETLLLNSNPKVRFLVNLLHFSLQPDDLERCFDMLNFLCDDGRNKHQFIQENLGDVSGLLKETYGFNPHIMQQSSVYDALEYAVKKFGLADNSDAYITYFLDVALEVEQREGSNAQVFLAFWEKKKDGLSISAPENVDAVHIMTVHKSKGLEFPIVIFPFANTNIYEEIDPKLWLSVPPEQFNGFEEVLINKKQEVLSYGPHAEAIYNEEQHKLELDAFNILYVALTRAVKALYVVSKKDLTTKGGHKTNLYSGLFIHYLKEKGLWEEGRDCYEFGSLDSQKEEGVKKGQHQKIAHLYTHKERPEFRILTKTGSLWDTQRETAISTGNLLHYAMGLIETGEDVGLAVDHLIANGDIRQEEGAGMIAKLRSITEHPKLSQYFAKGNKVKNEQDILTKEGKVLRPDRIVIKENRAAILDYKTGKHNPSYHEQLYSYSDALEEMGLLIQDRIIVYINEEIMLDFV